MAFKAPLFRLRCWFSGAGCKQLPRTIADRLCDCVVLWSIDKMQPRSKRAPGTREPCLSHYVSLEGAVAISKLIDISETNALPGQLLVALRRHCSAPSPGRSWPSLVVCLVQLG